MGPSRDDARDGKPGFRLHHGKSAQRDDILGSAIDLPKRVWEHRNSVVPGFTKRYGCHLLVWCEVHDSWEAARLRERQMKEWSAPGSCGRLREEAPDGRTSTSGLRDHDRVRNWAPAFAGVEFEGIEAVNEHPH
ncbi:GIY-YIG nuclease family protein [Sphingobium sp. AN558]|uniref:GIY-YIG nuclease family protein n=1 Tax=Sphingobium sp. AN558 TaxID=3133442 RepID=UPI004040C6ED